MTDNRQFRLAQRPTGLVDSSTFSLATEAAPTPGAGEALVRTLYLSLDPTNRIWMSDREQYMPPVGIGDVMRGGTLADLPDTASATNAAARTTR